MKLLQGLREADISLLVAALTALRPPNKGCLEASSLADGLCVSGVRFPKGADAIVQVGKEERMRGRRSGCLAGRRLVFGLVYGRSCNLCVWGSGGNTGVSDERPGYSGREVGIFSHMIVLWTVLSWSRVF